MESSESEVSLEDWCWESEGVLSMGLRNGSSWMGWSGCVFAESSVVCGVGHCFFFM